MAFGKHWEWRGFGDLASGERERLQSLPRKFPAAQEVTDTYLHVAGSPVNVKLRFNDLKFKRLLETSGPLELWLEDPAENHAFPIEPPALATLARDLGVRLPVAHGARVELPELLSMLAAATPPVDRIEVEKSRWQHTWQGGGDPEPVTVELAQIHAPQRVWSVGLEHPRAGAIVEAMSALRIEPALVRLNYLEALALWARGETIRGG